MENRVGAQVLLDPTTGRSPSGTVFAASAGGRRLRREDLAVALELRDCRRHQATNSLRGRTSFPSGSVRCCPGSPLGRGSIADGSFRAPRPPRAPHLIRARFGKVGTHTVFRSPQATLQLMPRLSPTGPVSARRRPVAAAYGAKGAPSRLSSRPGLRPAARGGAKRQVGGLTWAGRQAGLREIEGTPPSPWRGEGLGMGVEVGPVRSRLIVSLVPKRRTG